MQIESDAKPLLSMQDVRVSLQQAEFGPFNLRLQDGELVALLGPSGAGKSTLLKMMAGELQPRTGTIWFKQNLLKSWSLPRLSRMRAVLPQSHGIAFALPVDLVIGLGRVAYAADRQLDAIVRQAAKLANAGHLLGRRTDTLSGGELARVQMARVFAQLWDCERGLLLADEPLAALDPGLQLDLLAAMQDFASSRGHALVAVLHDVQQALSGFSRLLMLKDGKLNADLPAQPVPLGALEKLYDLYFATAKAADGSLLLAARRGAYIRHPYMDPDKTPIPENDESSVNSDKTPIF